MLQQNFSAPHITNLMENVLEPASVHPFVRSSVYTFKYEYCNQILSEASVRWGGGMIASDCKISFLNHKAHKSGYECYKKR